MRHAIVPAAGDFEDVTVPALRELKVYRRAHKDHPELTLPAPFSSHPDAVAVKAVNAVESTAKTVRPARRGRS